MPRDEVDIEGDEDSLPQSSTLQPLDITNFDADLRSSSDSDEEDGSAQAIGRSGSVSDDDDDDGNAGHEASSSASLTSSLTVEPDQGLASDDAIEAEPNEIAPVEKRPVREKRRMRAEDGEEGAFCICRKGVQGKFMVACDSCKEWFHTQCLGLLVKVVQKLSSFHCPKCRLDKGLPPIEEAYPDAVSPTLRAAASAFLTAASSTSPQTATPKSPSSPLAINSKLNRRTPTSPPTSAINSPPTPTTPMVTRSSKRLRSNTSADIGERIAELPQQSPPVLQPSPSPSMTLRSSGSQPGSGSTQHSPVPSADIRRAENGAPPVHTLPPPAHFSRLTSANRQEANKREKLRRRTTAMLVKALEAQTKDDEDSDNDNNLLSDIDGAGESRIPSLAARIEGLLGQKYPTLDAEYHSKVRSLVFNLKQNEELRRRVLSSELTPDQLVTMDSASLASSELQRMRKELEEESNQDHIITDVDPDHPLFGIIHEPVAAPQSKGASVQESFTPISHAALELIRGRPKKGSDTDESKDGGEEDEEDIGSVNNTLANHTGAHDLESDLKQEKPKKGAAKTESTGSPSERTHGDPNSIPTFSIPSFDSFAETTNLSDDDDDDDDNAQQAGEEKKDSDNEANEGLQPRTPPGTPPFWAFPEAGILAVPPSWTGSMGTDIVRQFKITGHTLVDVQQGQRPFRQLMPRIFTTKGRLHTPAFLSYLAELDRSASRKRAALLLQPASGMLFFSLTLFVQISHLSSLSVLIFS